MKVDMIRTFHPVGQGAFYTEQFGREGNGSDFCIVYDCGTKTRQELVDHEKVVKDALGDNRQPVDILFISHFDEDHVSMIGELVNNHPIKRVVLPLLPFEEQVVLLAHYNEVGNDIGRRLLVNPVELFGNETAVLYVEASGNEPINLSRNLVEKTRDLPQDADVVILKPNGEQVNAGRGQAVRIPSGATIFVPRHSWCCIPHNYEYPQRHQDLLNALAKRTDIDSASLGDASYVDSKLTELNEVYGSLKGGINENSMLVYSGPLECPIVRPYLWRSIIWGGCEIDCWREDRPACVYSGDANFNKVKIHEVYGSFWKNVGTVQIPHHGSGRSFSADFLDKSDRPYLCPVSTGYQHCHPSSSVLKDILIRHSFPLLVDYCPSSRLVQLIWYGE